MIQFLVGFIIGAIAGATAICAWALCKAEKNNKDK